MQLVYIFVLYAFLYTFGCQYLNKANDKLLVFPKNEALVGSVIIPFLSSLPDVLVSKNFCTFLSSSFCICIFPVWRRIGLYWNWCRSNGRECELGNDDSLYSGVFRSIQCTFMNRIWFASIPLTKSGLPDYKRKNEKESVQFKIFIDD